MTLATLLSGCPPTIEACRPQQTDAWPFTTTPGTVVIASYLLTVCGVALLGALAVFLLASRTRTVPLWRRKLPFAMLALGALSLVGAWFAWAVAQSYSQPGISPYAPFTEWQTHLTTASVAYLEDMAFLFVIAAAVAVIVTTLSLWRGVRSFTGQLAGDAGRQV